VEELVFEVCDKDNAYAELIGSVSLATPALIGGEVKEGWLPIKKKKSGT